MPWVTRMLANLLPRALIEASVRNVFVDPGRVTPAPVDRYCELTLRGIAIPTLILWGGRDRLIASADARAFAAVIAGS